VTGIPAKYICLIIPPSMGEECFQFYSKALGKLGNIVMETFVILDVSSNVSLFAHLWKHCCGNKNVS
jgi:hypothetical protein